MKVLPGIILALAWVAYGLVRAEEPGEFDRLMKLEGKALAVQAEESCKTGAAEFSPVQLCALAEKLFGELPGEEYFGARSLIFARACQKGDADSLVRLVGIFTVLPTDDAADRAALMVPLADLWLLVKTASWKQAPPTLQFPEWKRRLPPEIKALPQDLQKAWLTWKRATDSFVPPWTVEETRNSLAYQTNSKAFWQLIDDLLTGRGKAWSAELMRYQWGGWCGTGSEELTVPQSWALVMANMAENRLRQALAASFAVQPAPWFYRNDEKYRGLHQFLQDSGFDWQAAVAGGLANSIAFYSVGDQIRNNIAVGLLVEYGGEKSAQLLLQIARHAPAEDKFHLLWAYAQFVTPGSAAGAPTKRSNGEPISEETQTEILQEISNQVVDNSRFEVSETLARTMASLRRLETKEALYRLLQHPSEKIARQAEKTLNDLGEKVTMPPKLGPVRYQVSVDGQFLAEKEIQWHLKTGSCSVNSSSKADASGIVDIDRDHFFDLNHVRPEVRLFCAQMKEPSDLWFNVEVPPPAENDMPLMVKVETKPFDFLVASPDANPLEIKISKVAGKVDLDPVGTVNVKPSSSPIRFAALPAGQYRLEVLSPETVPWSGQIDTTKENTLRASLEKASKVCFSLALPKGWEDSDYVFVDLFKDGKRVENAYVPSSEGSKVRAFQMLAPGKYVLKVPSSKELHKFDPETFPARPAFEAMEVFFEITADSASRIDLGELRPKAL